MKKYIYQLLQEIVIINDFDKALGKVMDLFEIHNDMGGSAEHFFKEYKGGFDKGDWMLYCLEDRRNVLSDYIAWEIKHIEIPKAMIEKHEKEMNVLLELPESVETLVGLWLNVPSNVEKAKTFLCGMCAEANSGGDDIFELLWNGVKAYKDMPKKDVIELIFDVFIDDDMTEGRKVVVLEDILNYGTPK